MSSMPWATDCAVSIFRMLSNRELLEFARCSSSEWHIVLEDVPRQLLLRSLSLSQRPCFSVLTNCQRSAVLRFLPVLEKAFFFENFNTWPTRSARAVPSHEHCTRELAGRGGVSTEIAGTSHLHPLSVWCGTIAKPETFQEASRFLWHFSSPIRPRFVAFQVCCACPSPRMRCGGIFRLSSEGGGPWRANEKAALCVSFNRDSTGRSISVCARGSEASLGAWEDGAWYEVIAQFQWEAGITKVSVRPDPLGPTPNPRVVPRPGCCTFPFCSKELCSELKLFNLASDFRASWTDILVI
mmetsp:Transcript_4547/g.7859  ORF Transcript_4547/g.7859 Transcript_4547/m.7859 type:complete len:297 (+) Transcript_4547:74-964(+)